MFQICEIFSCSPFIFFMVSLLCEKIKAPSSLNCGPETAIFSTLIKEKADMTLTSEPEFRAWFQEDFSELLNQPLTPATEELIDQANHPNDFPLCTTDFITPEEVRKALGQQKNARASGI